MSRFGKRFVVLLFVLAAVPAFGRDIEKRVTDPVFHGEVYYHESGPEQAPAVVLVHGLGDKASNDWDSLAADLSRDFRVARFDLPGFGRSDKGNLAYTPERYAQFLHALVNRELRTRPFFLVGHSMGGAIALRYAALFPQDVKALVLADVPAILHRFVYSRHMAILGLSRKVPGLYPGSNDMLGNMLGKAERKSPPVEMVVQFAPLRQKLLKGEPGLIAGLALALEDFSNDIARVTVPTLLLWGERDEVAPLRSGQALQATLAQARLEIFPGVGHTPMDDAPEPFNARLRGFLEDPTIPHRNSVLHDDSPLPDSQRIGRCNGKRDRVFEGDYQSIHIDQCKHAVLRRVQTRQLDIRHSTVSIVDSRIGGGKLGMTAVQSRVTLTGSRIEGDTAIQADTSRIDLAGCRVVGRETAMRSEDTAEVAFSVSQVESRLSFGPMHGLRYVTPENPL